MAGALCSVGVRGAWTLSVLSRSVHDVGMGTLSLHVRMLAWAPCLWQCMMHMREAQCVEVVRDTVVVWVHCRSFCSHMFAWLLWLCSDTLILREADCHEATYCHETVMRLPTAMRLSWDYEGHVIWCVLVDLRVMLAGALLPCQNKQFWREADCDGFVGDTEALWSLIDLACICR